jgi:hypothetical protein
MTALLLLAALLADGRIEFTKVFPKSDPAYVGITVESTGAAVFKTDPRDEQPVIFQLSPSETSELFALANKVDLTKRWETPLKVAFMGTKTVSYENNGKTARQVFNYTDDVDARALTDWFERISESEQCFIDLERSVKYEKIGVKQALLGLQSEWERKRLVAVLQFLPLLDRVIKSDSYLQMARKRAQALADTFREVK